jgi:uroporphyrinogen decarboxylase
MTYSEMDRFRDALQGKPRDRVPIFPMVAGWVAGNFSDKPLSEIGRSAKLLVEAQIRAKEAVGYDAFFAYAEPLYIPEAFGCKVRYTETGPLADPLPLTVNDLDSLEKIPSPDPRKDGRLPVILEAVSELSAYGGGSVPVLGLFEGAFTTTCRILEADLIMRMILKKRDTLQALLTKVNHFLLEFGRALIESGANVIFLPEPSASSSMISPKTFKELVLPRIQDLTSALRAPFMLHICGDTLPILDSMARTGARVLSLDQCMNLAESRQRAPNVALGGNVDPTNSLFMGDEKRVVENTLNCLRSATTSRFVLMSGCGVPPKTPIQNLRAMVRTAVDYGLGLSDD